MRKILLATAAGFAAMVADGATPARAQQAAEVSGQTPQPGLTLSTSGRFRFHGAFISQDGRSDDAGNKLSNYDFNTYGRLRFDLDGVSATGLRYGGRLEARMASGGGNNSADLFLRRVTGYVGTQTLGQLRFGSGNVQAVEQMYIGHIMGSIATGLLDGDAGDFLYSGQGGQVANNFWYSSSGVNRSTAIGYYSPQFFGFDLGLSFAPNEKGFLGDCNTGAGIQSCDRIATVASGNANQLRNIIDAMIRYRGTFGPVGIAASGGVRTAATPSAVGTATSFKNPTVGVIGAQVTFAGFTVGGITTFGSANRGFTALPSTGNNDSMFSWQLGARYTIGALTLGAAYHELKSEGDPALAANQRDRGFGIGASYALAPGLALFTEYLWSRVSQSGRDFDSGKAGVQDKFKAQAFLLGIGIGF